MISGALPFEVFENAIKDAVDNLDTRETYAGTGRPSACLKDVLKSLLIKSYHNLSSWRIEAELHLAKSHGVIEQVYKKTSINKYLNSDKITHLLHELISTLALPISPIETQFAIDATGISNAYKSKKWVEVRLDHRLHRQYNKLHILSGTLTNTVVCAEVSEGTKHDSPFLKGLVERASAIIPMREISADAGYLSRDNCDAITDVGAIPFIKPKKNIKEKQRGSSAWARMIRLWKNNQLVFAQHYHRRSNVESTFGSLKRKFGDFCRAKNTQAQTNEILSRIACHNACVLAEAMLSYNVTPEFTDS